jgi:hypothetical protein
MSESTAGFVTEPFSEPNAKLPPKLAIEICAVDLGVAPSDVHVLPRASSGILYKSKIFYIGSKGSETPRYVVKVDSGAYDPEQEQRGFEYATSALERGPDKLVGQLGVVRPLGWGEDPNFLVTRYQPGELANEAIDDAILRGKSPERIAQAHANARLLARWIGVFRTAGAEPGGGLEPAAYLEEVRERAVALARVAGRKGRLDRVVGHLERDLEQLGPEDLERMRCRYPIRGDARPKNFMVGTDAALYALDMEGFGFGPMEHDVSCLHHALEYDAWRLPAAARRADALWEVFWNEYMQHDGSPSLVLLGYVYFLLERMRKTIELDASAGWKRKLRTRVWLRSRFAWLSRLNGKLADDLEHMRQKV